MKNILVVEDDRGLREGIELALRRDEFGFTLCESMGKARAALSGGTVFDLVLLDLNLPDGSGYDLLKEIKDNHGEIPVIILTANDFEMDEVRGLELGAEDYITKPFSLMVLISKVNAWMRRISQKEEGRQILSSGNIRMDCREMKVYKDDKEILLSKRELQLLLYFLRNPKQILSKEQILGQVWDVEGQFVDDNTVPVTIGRLKKKVSEGEEPEYIKNVRGMGYIWMMDVVS